MPSATPPGPDSAPHRPPGPGPIAPKAGAGAPRPGSGAPPPAPKDAPTAAFGPASPAGPPAAPSPPRVRPADAAGIAEAVRMLAAGGIVALPTETVYGLAADAENPQAVARIYAAKGRPAANPLIVHVADPAMAARYARLSPPARRLARAFWPGPLTLVLPRRAGAPLAPAVAAGLATVALRAPAHPAMQAVIAGLGRGLAAPSANPSGRLSPTRAAHVVASGLPVPLVLDGGPSAAGLESTIVKVSEDGPPRLLRPGAIAPEAIEAVLGAPLRPPPPPGAGPSGGPVEAPGTMFRHYAPRRPLLLGVTAPRPDAVLLGFGAVAGDLSLSPAGDPAEAARNLFAMLHEAEALAEARGAAFIAVAPIPAEGLGLAIRDRLARAAGG